MASHKSKKTKKGPKKEQKKEQKKDRKKAKASAPKKAGSASAEATSGGMGMPTFKHVAKKKLSTGKGASAAEIGKSLVDLFNQGKTDEFERLWHHKQIESIEGDGSVFLGRKGVNEKNAWWYGAFEMHSGIAEGPFVGATGFSVRFTIEVTPRAGGERMTFTEVGVYTVSKGKIAREEFMGLCKG